MAAKKKAPKKRNPRAAAKKKATKTRKPKAVRKKATSKPQASPATTELDQRIAIVRNNLRELSEQAAAYSGASSEELVAERIAQQEAKLQLLLKEREALARR
jgi:hypothetical protein